MPFLAPLVTQLAIGLTTTFNLIGVPAALSGKLAFGVIQLGSSLLLSAASNALFGPKAPKAQDLTRELSSPSTEPSYRFVYGRTRATGTPVGTPVRGDSIWGCWILNSRPSSLSEFKLFLDKREVALEGDVFDFEGVLGPDGHYGGASGTEFPFLDTVRVWVSRGDQASPPRQFLERAAYGEGADEELWKPSDGWQGVTVIWLKLRAGNNKERQERWPSTPPLVEVEGDWSLVWNPRDAGQDLEDPSTWTWSDNHALCVLDALTQNPIRQYRELNLHLSSFIDAADVSDQLVQLKSGGTERRYRAAGTLSFSNSEIEDQVNPLVLSGGADLIQIGGKRGLACGEYREPTLTVDDFVGDGFEVEDLIDEHDLVTTLRVSYLSKERGYETAPLKPWDIPGALEEDSGVRTVRDLDLAFCPSPTQGMRIRKIKGLRMRRQQRLTCVLPPRCFNLVGGSTAMLSAADPSFSMFDGVYEVESIHPGVDPVGESGEVAMRLPATLVHHSADIYAWGVEEEEEIVDEPYDGKRKGVAAPGEIEAITGDAANLSTGDSLLPRVLYEFAASSSNGVDHYEWQSRDAGGSWGEGSGSIDGEVRNGSGEVFVYVQGAAGQAQDFRVRAISGAGGSPWREILGVTPVVDLDLDLPTGGTAEETEPGTVEVRFTVPNDPDVQAIEIFGGPTSDPNDAGALDDPIYASQNGTVILEEIGLGSGVTRYYFARSRGAFGSASAFTAPLSVTTA